LLDFDDDLSMKPLKKSEVLIAATLLLAGCNGCNKTKPPTAAGPTAPLPPSGIDPLRGHLLRAQPKLPTIRVWVGAEELETEIARTDLQIATGMMFRTNMPENTAMIFVFDNVQARNFYMRNCVVPLSAGYIEPNGTLAEIVKLEPGDEAGVPSKSSNLQFVLEVPQGWFERHNVKTGAIVRTEKGSLQETFFRR
jgi:uncharacterized membrane protein (UPF0127 family)